VKQFREFASEKGYVLIDQFQITDMDDFYSRWKDGIRAKAKKLERLKGFFHFCLKRKWVSENPAADLEAPVGSGTAAHRMPFTDSELVRIYEACDKLPEVQWKNHLGSGSWGGDDVKSMVMLLCWTGLRISDGATFDMSRVTPHPDGGANIFLRMHKTKGPLFTWADDWLYERLGNRHRYLAAQDQPRIRSRRRFRVWNANAAHLQAHVRAPPASAWSLAPRRRRSYRRHRRCGGETLRAVGPGTSRAIDEHLAREALHCS
jgi:site-specific recombinase XerC